MIGGNVIEVIHLESLNRIWINTKDRKYNDTCAVYVEMDDKAKTVSVGDIIWWQGGHALWTPKDKSGNNVGPYDIKLKKIGYSGVSRPIEETK